MLSSLFKNKTLLRKNTLFHLTVSRSYTSPKLVLIQANFNKRHQFRTALLSVSGDSMSLRSFSSDKQKKAKELIEKLIRTHDLKEQERDETESIQETEEDANDINIRLHQKLGFLEALGSEDRVFYPQMEDEEEEEERIQKIGESANEMGKDEEREIGGRDYMGDLFSMAGYDQEENIPSDINEQELDEMARQIKLGEKSIKLEMEEAEALVEEDQEERDMTGKEILTEELANAAPEDRKLLEDPQEEEEEHIEEREMMEHIPLKQLRTVKKAIEESDEGGVDKNRKEAPQQLVEESEELLDPALEAELEEFLAEKTEEDGTPSFSHTYDDLKGWKESFEDGEDLGLIGEEVTPITIEDVEDTKLFLVDQLEKSSQSSLHGEDEESEEKLGKDVEDEDYVEEEYISEKDFPDIADKYFGPEWMADHPEDIKDIEQEEREEIEDLEKDLDISVPEQPEHPIENSLSDLLNEHFFQFAAPHLPREKKVTEDELIGIDDKYWDVFLNPNFRDEDGDYTFDHQPFAMPFERLIDVGRHSVVRRQGRVVSYSASVLVGDMNGTAGIGYGKGPSPARALSNARRDAFRNLITITRFQGRTILSHLEYKHITHRVRIQSLRKGSGLRAYGVAADVARAFGLTDVRIYLQGPRHKRHRYQALFRAITQPYHDEKDFALATGKKLIDRNLIWKPPKHRPDVIEHINLLKTRY